MKSIFNIAIGVLLLALIIVGITFIIWGVPGKSYKLTEKYLTTGDYSIGKQQYYNNICKNDIGCLNGKLLGFKKIENNSYLYIEINYGKGGSINKESGELEVKDYNYYLFERSNDKVVDNVNDLPMYGILIDNNLNFYSQNDLEKLPEEQMKIFEDLEKNPSIVIDGVNYSK